MTAYLTIAGTFSLADLEAFVKKARALQAGDDYPVDINGGALRVQVHVTRTVVPPKPRQEKPTVIKPEGVRSRARKRAG